MIMLDDIKYFTLPEVAKMFGKKTQTVSNWRRDGKLKGKQISARKYIFSEIELKNFVEGVDNG